MNLHYLPPGSAPSQSSAFPVPWATLPKTHAGDLHRLASKKQASSIKRVHQTMERDEGM